MVKYIEEMAGQRLMLGFDGTELNEDLKHIIGSIRAGGLVLFKRNIRSPEQVKTLCERAQEYAGSSGLPPLFISVDEEGGTVTRLKEPFTVFRGNPYIRNTRDAENFANITADKLNSVGINMNLAPVLDIAGFDSTMKDRTFKGDATNVSKLGTAVIRAMQDKNIMAVAKHFPGIGRTTKDSHFSLPVLDIDPEILEKTDIRPFVAAIRENVTGIMLSHISYPRLDSKWQASLSPLVAKDLLRRKLGYNGLVMTDDLNMKSVKPDIKTCIRQILISDIDIALICRKGSNTDTAYEEITRRLNQDEELLRAGEKSLERILRYKKKYL